MNSAPKEASPEIRNALIDLQRMKKREEELKKECQTLFLATSVLNSALDINKVLITLMRVLKQELKFDQSFIVVKDENKNFKTMASTSKDFQNISFKAKENFKKITKDRPLISHNVRDIPEWESILIPQLEWINSAFHIPLNGNKMHAILICVHREKGHFSKQHLRLANSLVPVARQAILNLEKQEKLQSEIDQRIKAQKKSEELKAKLLEKAYHEGFAEHAVSVLHNIGNLVTPVTVKLDALVHSKLLDELDSSCSSAVNFLNSQEASAEQKVQKMLIFFEHFQEQMKSGQEEWSENLKAIGDQVNKISNTIVAQQKYANSKENIKGKISCSELIEDAVNSYSELMEKHGIELHQDIQTQEEVYININGAHHLFLNLISNSIDSLVQRKEQAPDHKGHIKIRVEPQYPNIKFTLEDNGIGIEPERLSKIFSYGHTSKEKGSGFGLHSCSNYIKNNNGQINVNSPGINKGVCAEVILPTVQDY